MLVQLRENPLRPAIIFWISRRDLFRPVKTKSKSLELADEIFLGLIVRLTRFFTNFDGIIFHWQAKAIPADRMIGIIPLLTLGAHLDVGKLIRTPMTDMDARTSDTWQHAKSIIFRLARVIEIYGIRAITLPNCLPSLLNVGWIVSFHTC